MGTDTGHKGNGKGANLVIDSTALKLIGDAVMKQCDALDGVEDGILNDPRQRNFDVASPACEKGKSEGCLSPSRLKPPKRYATTSKLAVRSFMVGRSALNTRAHRLGGIVDHRWTSIWGRPGLPRGCRQR